jgi:hypothetical protein
MVDLLLILSQIAVVKKLTSVGEIVIKAQNSGSPIYKATGNDSQSNLPNEHDTAVKQPEFF